MPHRKGLSALVFDTRVIGGQAGASSRIENYFGFPTGISGQALAGRAFVQAQKFGADVVVPVAVKRLDCGGTPLALDLDCGSRLSARTVVIASGRDYRRPAIPDLAKYEGPRRLLLGVADRGPAVPAGRSGAGRRRQFRGAGGRLSREPCGARAPADTRARSREKHVDDIWSSVSTSLPNVTLHAETEIVALEG